jgi:glycosyltransferase involved in cell wall biosynthesis
MIETKPAAPDGYACMFSVIINIYNGEVFLEEAIDSVLAQRFEDWELILWDDGSTDRTQEICATYTDPRIRYVRSPENRGLGSARNASFAIARGRWITYLDHDDIWLPNKLAAQHALIEADRTGRLALVYGRTLRFDYDGNKTPFDPWYGPGQLPEGDIFTDLLRRATFIALSSSAFRQDVFKSLGGIPDNIKYCSDYYICLAIAKNYRAACVQELCCYYRVHPTSMSHLFKEAMHGEAIYILDTLAGPEHRQLVAGRRKIHESWIGVEDLRRGKLVEGAARILRRGAPWYLALRPLAMVYRSVRNRARVS